MTAEQHEIIYNIGMRLTCNNSIKIHLCPVKRNYEYFVYWSETTEKKEHIFGNAIGKKKVQLKRQTGEEVVSLDECVPICTKKGAGNRVQMIWQSSSYDREQSDNMIKALDILLAQSVRNVAIEKTLVLKENEEGWDIPIIDFIDVFDARALLTHFRSLFKCFLEEIILGNKGADVIDRIKNLLQNWERIYHHKDNVLDQIEDYMNLSLEGIEGISGVPDDLGYLSGVIKEELKGKKAAGDFLSFLLREDFDKECFRECITILAAFLKKYAKNGAEDLLFYLEKYENKELQIHKVAKLHKIDLNSSKAKKANAKLIEIYLADKIKYSCGVMFECIV